MRNICFIASVYALWCSASFAHEAASVSESGPGRDMKVVLAEKVADKKQYALDVANIEKYDRGQIERTGPHKDGPLSNQGERYLSFRPTLPPSVILYCYIMEPRELAVMDLTKTDVVVSVREHHDERCSFVVMSKEQFAKHKKTFLAYNTRQVARESEERADEQRLRVAYEAWKVGQRPLHK